MSELRSRRPPAATTVQSTAATVPDVEVLVAVGVDPPGESLVAKAATTQSSKMSVSGVNPINCFHLLNITCAY